MKEHLNLEYPWIKRQLPKFKMLTEHVCVYVCVFVYVRGWNAKKKVTSACFINHKRK